MDGLRDPNEPRRLTALADLLAEAGGDSDWLVDPATAFKADDDVGVDGPLYRWRQIAQRRRRLLPIGAATVALTAAAIVVVSQLHSTSGALADPTKAAAAADRAGSFAFITRSELFAAGSPAALSTTHGVVSLKGSGAFKVRVMSPPGVGFERVVVSHAMYVRVVDARGERAWVGVHLKPAVRVSTEAGSSGGLGDPLSLLSGLAHSHDARRESTAIVDGRDTRHYVLTLPLDALLARGTTAPASLRSIPVRIDVWQASDQQLVRAIRTYDIGGPRHLRLTIWTDFRGYGRPAVIKVPRHTPLVGYQPPNATADDPLGESVLGSLAAGRGHSANPNAAAARVPGVAGAPPAGPGPQP